MDEEDGRLGPRARQSGAADVLKDANARILCQSGRSGSLSDNLHARTTAEIRRVVRNDLRRPAAEAARSAHLRVTEGESR